MKYCYKKLLIHFLTLIGFVLVFSSCKKQSEKLPNIIYILADDLGYGDISVLNPNSKIQTPSIDKIASQGMTFTDAHSNSAVCTPTRYGVLTGRYAWRTWVKSGVLWSYDKMLIDKQRETVPSLLKKSGYQTACIGKWHLGLDWGLDSNNEIDFKLPLTGTPNDIGFDEFYGITASLDIPPYFYIKNRNITATRIDSIHGTTGKGFWRKGPIGDDFKHEDVLPHLTNKAVNYIQKNANQKDPFFLYFPLPAPHTPILPTPEFKGKSESGTYGDFVMMVDDVVNQVMTELKNQGIEENTIVIFTSDNGFSPAADLKEQLAFGHHPSYNLRGHKADIFEGGHRVPFIMQWPKKIKKGKVATETICLTDLLATVAELTNQEIAQNTGEDSYSILPVMFNKKLPAPLREATVHHSIDGVFSIRQGPWKLIFGPGSGGWSAPKDKKARTDKLPLLQLYNLKDDISETTNVASNHPEIISELTKLMDNYVVNGRSTPGYPQKNDTSTEFEPKPYQ